jgi:hypothetical protein
MLNNMPRARRMRSLLVGDLCRASSPPGDWAHNGARTSIQNPVTGSRWVAVVLATKAMAEETGMTVILGTGHHFEHPFDVDWFDRTSTAQTARHLVADLEGGDPRHRRARRLRGRDRLRPAVHHGP